MSARVRSVSSLLAVLLVLAAVAAAAALSLADAGAAQVEMCAA